MGRPEIKAMKKLIAIIALSCLLLAGCSAKTYEAVSGPSNDLIAWQLDWVTEDLLKENSIDRLFVQFSEENWKTAKKYQGTTNVCFIDGGKDWNRQTMIDYLDAVAKTPVRVAAFDCEGWYANQEPTAETLAAYVDDCIVVYQYAQKLGIRMCVVFPYWSEVHSVEQLERLVREGCDELHVMDFYIPTVVENIENELAFCKEYGKTCQIVFEISNPDKEGLSSDISYWKLGSEQLQDDMNFLRYTYGDDFGFTIHQAKYYKDFLEK